MYTFTYRMFMHVHSELLKSLCHSLLQLIAMMGSYTSLQWWALTPHCNDGPSLALKRALASPSQLLCVYEYYVADVIVCVTNPAVCKQYSWRTSTGSITSYDGCHNINAGFAANRLLNELSVVFSSCTEHSVFGGDWSSKHTRVCLVVLWRLKGSRPPTRPEQGPRSRGYRTKRQCSRLHRTRWLLNSIFVLYCTVIGRLKQISTLDSVCRRSKMTVSCCSVFCRARSSL